MSPGRQPPWPDVQAADMKPTGGAPRRVQDGTGTDAQVAQHWRERALKAEAQRDKARGVVEAARAVVRSIPPPIDLKGVPLHDLDVALATFDAKPTDSEGER